MPLTLKQAVAYLAASPTPYSLPTLRKAIIKGTLKSAVVETDVQKYRVVEVEDLEAWINNESAHKHIGRPKPTKDKTQ